MAVDVPETEPFRPFEQLRDVGRRVRGIDYEPRTPPAVRQLPVTVEDAVPGDRPPDLDDADLLDLYLTMARIRAFEMVIDA